MRLDSCLPWGALEKMAGAKIHVRKISRRNTRPIFQTTKNIGCFEPFAGFLRFDVVVMYFACVAFVCWLCLLSRLLVRFFALFVVWFCGRFFGRVCGLFVWFVLFCLVVAVV